MSRHVSLRPLLAAVALLVSLTPVLAAEPQSGPPRDRPWKLVFADEFNGPRLDETKWSRSRNHGDAFCWNGAKGRVSEDHAAVDGRGNFVIRVTRDPDGTYVYSHGVQTRGKFQRAYGYYETRAKFTRQPGWWGGVWL